MLLGILAIRSVCLRTDDLIYAIVVEPNRNTTWCEEHGYAVAHNYRSGVVYFKSLAPVQLNSENAEGLSL